MGTSKLYKGFYTDVRYLINQWKTDIKFTTADCMRSIEANLAYVERERRHPGTVQRPLGQLLLDAAESEAYGQPF